MMGMAKNVAIIGKPVRDMYGTDIGNVLGTLTDIDGSIQTVGVDCSSDGLKQIPFAQLVLQGDIVIYIPKWRLDAQKILREKGLTLRRLNALMAIVSENDEMKSDAELIHETYNFIWNCRTTIFSSWSIFSEIFANIIQQIIINY